MYQSDWDQFYPSEAAVIEDFFAESIPTRIKTPFKGEGWYFASNDVLLIIKSGDGFEVYCWNSPSRDPRDVLRGLCELPNQTLQHPSKT